MSIFSKKDDLEPRKGAPSPKIGEKDFKKRFLSSFRDPYFDAARAELDTISSIAWQAYSEGRKAPHTSKAGNGYANPDYDLANDWIAAKADIDKAQASYEDKNRPLKILLINASPRSEHTCPGEISKSFRLARICEEVFNSSGTVDTNILDLSRLTSEYGRNIHPCKACYSTAAALCHWPCSCYPNYSLGQTQDWMNDIYPMWVEADGIMIITPVNWYQASSPLKLMMDRLVCADGGNPDPTSTHGKKAKEAKEIEMNGWDYPRHLKGRLFSVIVHGDTEGAEGVRRSLSDWLKSMELTPAGPAAELDRYIGYWKPYATNHLELDADTDIQNEVRNAAKTLVKALTLQKNGRLPIPGENLEQPRNK